ncbi:hypothetical protein ACVOMV_07390 [Mesorhizobium atlanticum]
MRWPIGHEADAGQAARKLSERRQGLGAHKADHPGDAPARPGRGQRARWLPFLRLIECADDAADELEEAVFVLSLIAEHNHHGWNDELRAARSRRSGRQGARRGTGSRQGACRCAHAQRSVLPRIRMNSWPPAGGWSMPRSYATR